MGSLTIASALAYFPLPRLEARVLLMHAVPGLNHANIIANPEGELTAEQQTLYCLLASKRLAGLPIAYLLGRREFYSRSFEVSPAVLIPRPETEHLVETALFYGFAGARVVDLGTGSGAVAITLALEGDKWDVTATDVSDDALELARRNAVVLGASVRFFLGDWYAALPHGERFDLIVSNPPYIAQQDPHLLVGDVAFEPSIALSDGADGLRCIVAIAQSATTWLTDQGWLLVEHGYDQGRAVRGIFEQAGLAAVQSITDLAGHERITVGQATL